MATATIKPPATPPPASPTSSSPALAQPRQAEMDALQTQLCSLISALQHEWTVLQDEKELLAKKEGYLLKNQTDNNPDECVSVDVGGRIFNTSKATLRTFPNSMLGVLVSGKFGVAVNKDGNIFIDRNPKWFGWILDYLRGVKDANSSQSEIQPSLTDKTTSTGEAHQHSNGVTTDQPQTDEQSTLALLQLCHCVLPATLRDRAELCAETEYYGLDCITNLLNKHDGAGCIGHQPGEPHTVHCANRYTLAGLPCSNSGSDGLGSWCGASLGGLADQCGWAEGRVYKALTPLHVQKQHNGFYLCELDRLITKNKLYSITLTTKACTDMELTMQQLDSTFTHRFTTVDRGTKTGQFNNSLDNVIDIQVDSHVFPFAISVSLNGQPWTPKETKQQRAVSLVLGIITNPINSQAILNSWSASWGN
eukprot:TRINITY_DN64257_c0_g2_i1.p1 TRINITY_DN64257_c0_g2~~TRINITY_DN64257_c0_g2_i1.p1  ORF type:complete len:421 (-),score=53.82 TRINITY_DN64257_c0_g2_i1:68-1330(-)